MYQIELATVLPGALPFKEGNVNETFRGIILLADGRSVPAILKDLDLYQLANELAASVLAQSVGLPTPNSYLGIIRNNELAVTKAPTIAGGGRLIFASTDVNTPNVNFRLSAALPNIMAEVFNELTEWDELGSLYAFDTWIANTDRHQGNLLLGGKGKVWLIDHGHSFSGPSWLGAQPDPYGQYVNRLAQWLTPKLEPSSKSRQASQARAFLGKIADLDLPDELVDSKIDVVLRAEDAQTMVKRPGFPEAVWFESCDHIEVVDG